MSGSINNLHSNKTTTLVLIVVSCFLAGYLWIVHMVFTDSINTQSGFLTRPQYSVSNPLSYAIPSRIEENISSRLPSYSSSLVPKYGFSSLPNITGVIVLGMHRSGTSMLTGLMTKMGLNVGDPSLLIGPKFDNKKGFFERIDVVLQDDAIMSRQGVNWASKVGNFNHLQALDDLFKNDMKNGKFFAEGRRGLAFLNNPTNFPWILKDPRLCVTIRFWLPLLSSLPAVVFTYRHPLQVATSLKEREGFTIVRGLKLWIAYNKLAIENSKDLCRVVSSNFRLISEPDIELKRIRQELSLKCNVGTPYDVSKVDLDSFMDPSLQHSTEILDSDKCNLDKLQTTQPDEEAWYNTAMGVYCGLKNGSAYLSSFSWPTVDI